MIEHSFRDGLDRLARRVQNGQRTYARTGMERTSGQYAARRALSSAEVADCECPDACLRDHEND